jgi:starch synthase
MPRYGCINERRNQLHEVIRLSGMNLIINDNDHQLIIKVASIPAARLQIYFIDNDDCFSRKAVMTDEAGKPFEDNDERAIFFARGVLETVKKLRWEPTIVHCHGWFSSIVPIYLREVFSDDPIFKGVKIVASIYDDGFEGELSDEMTKKIVNEGVDVKNLKNIEHPSYQNLMKLVIDYADGIVVETPTLDAEVADYLAASGKKVLEYQDKTTTEYLDNYQKFYDELL